MTNKEKNENKDSESFTERKRACIKEMKDTMRLIGPWSVNKSEMAKKYDVAWTTVDKWFTELVQSAKPEQISNIKVMGEASLRRSLATCEKILADPNSPAKTRLDAVTKVNETLSKQTDFLERYGLKETAPTELKIDSNTNLDIERLAAIAQGIRKKDENPPGPQA